MVPILSLRQALRGGANLLEGGPTVVPLDAESEWIFEGPVDIIDSVEHALAGFSARLGTNVLRVRFGNAVGAFRLPGLPTLEVTSRKWGEEQFDRLLADIVRIASALPFAEGAPSPLPYDRSLAAREDVLYHAFVYLRYVLSKRAPVEDRLGPAMAAILQEPHRRFEKTSRMVPIEMATGADSAVMPEAIASGLFPAPRWMAHKPLARGLRGHLPVKVMERNVTHDFDTPENRFVKGFLDMALAVVRAVEAAVEERKESRKSLGRLSADCVDMRRKIETLLATSFWQSIGRMTFVPAASTVLHRKRGYRDVFRHFSRLRLASKRLPLSQHTVRDLLEARDIAKLYELWTFFATVDVMKELLGEPARADVHDVSAFQIDVRRGFSVTWPQGETLVYNACFDKHAARPSYSVRLFPDITLELPDGRVHVFDAKFKLKWRESNETDDTEALPKTSWSEDDLYKMHAYRDAIVRADSAWILYPGQEFRYYARHGLSRSTTEPLGAPIVGVGAIPFAPGAEERNPLREVLSNILGRGL